ncbi:MAG: hypothetical protein AAGJ93_12955, partial [Bacteroidota bacterium]
FSPNGSSNNRFHVYAGPSVAEIISFQVYSRWGSQVFLRENFEPTIPPGSNYGWDGKLSGENMNPAVFVWYIEFRLIDGTIQVCQGDVALVR